MRAPDIADPPPPPFPEGDVSLDVLAGPPALTGFEADRLDVEGLPAQSAT